MQGDYFPGLLPLVQAYLEHIRCDPAIVTKVNKYLDLVARRARVERAAARHGAVRAS